MSTNYEERVQDKWERQWLGEEGDDEEWEWRSVEWE